MKYNNILYEILYVVYVMDYYILLQNHTDSVDNLVFYFRIYMSVVSFLEAKKAIQEACNFVKGK
jgi:hypothetical protein